MSANHDIAQLWLTERRIVLFQLIGSAVMLVAGIIGRSMMGDADGMSSWNAATLILFTGLSAFSVYRLIRLDAYNVWMPITLFILSSTIFLGFGPLSHIFGNEGTLMYLAVRPPTADAFDVNRAFILSMAGQVGIYSGIVAASFMGNGGGISADRKSAEPLISPGSLAIAFVVIGLLFKYLVYYPANWGIIDVTLPGVFSAFNAIAALGFGLWIYDAIQSKSRSVFLILLLILMDFSFTILDFYKEQIVLSLAFPLAGYYMATKNRTVTMILALAIVAIYSASTPMVTYARSVGVLGDVPIGFSERAEIAVEYISERPEVVDREIFEGAQKWWTRLDASGRQAFAMHLRDIGHESHSLNNALIIFIPRIVWPDKPIIYPPGQEFYYIVTGRTNNFMSITIYGDMYWQFGWVGVILISPIFGLILYKMNYILYGEIRNNNFIYFPAILIASEVALVGQTKFIQNGFLMSTFLFFVYILMTRFLTGVILDGKRGRRFVAKRVS